MGAKRKRCGFLDLAVAIFVAVVAVVAVASWATWSFGYHLNYSFCFGYVGTYDYCSRLWRWQPVWDDCPVSVATALFRNTVDAAATTRMVHFRFHQRHFECCYFRRRHHSSLPYHWLIHQRYYHCYCRSDSENARSRGSGGQPDSSPRASYRGLPASRGLPSPRTRSHSIYLIPQRRVPKICKFINVTNLAESQTLNLILFVWHLPLQSMTRLGRSFHMKLVNDADRKD